MVASISSAVSLLAVACLTAVSATIVPGAFIFEFEENADKEAVLNSFNEDGYVRMRLSYELFDGVSVQLHDVEKANTAVSKFAALPAIKRWWPVTSHDVPDVEVHWTGNPDGGDDLQSRKSTVSDNESTHMMTQIDKLHAKGHIGKGVRVAVIDTGVDYKHPAMGGCYGDGCLVSFGHDFVGDNFTGRNSPIPDDDPMDCQGHGTHVAGIVAATDTKLGFTGGAPGVTLGAYRVFGCDGSTNSDTIIAALNRAYQDKANIITLSIGGPNGWKENAWAVAASRIVSKGVIVTISAGNEGKEGVFYGSSGASGQGVASIASYTNKLTPTLLHFGNITVSGKEPEEFSYVLGSPDKFDTTLPLWADTFDTKAPADFCEPLASDAPDLGQKIVLIRRGTCTWDEKVKIAAAKGAKYILFYNSGDDPSLYLSLKSLIPATVQGVGFLDKKTGEEWVNRLAQGQNITLSLGSSLDSKILVQNIDNPTSGGALSTFTSWGPTWTMDVKPQFGAPGGQILSTYPRAKGSYAVLSGTSMACPLVAAVYALLIEVRGTHDPMLLEKLLSANANPQVFNNGSLFYEYLAPVAQQGGGLVQAYDTAFATTVLEPSSLSFNETTYFARNKTFTLTNQGDGEVSYNISYVSAVTAMTLKKDGKTVIPFPGELHTRSATVQFNTTQIKLRKGDKATVQVAATPPNIDGARLPLWSGYIRINGTDGTSLSLPYQGLVGSLHDHTVLDRNATWIINSGDKDHKPVALNTTFTMPKQGPTKNFTLPAVAFNATLGSRLMQFHVVPVSPYGGPARPLGQTQESPVRYNARGRDYLSWEGKLNNGKYVPEGSYRILVRALRLYGNEKMDIDWDESTTPPFGIKYV